MTHEGRLSGGHALDHRGEGGDGDPGRGDGVVIVKLDVRKTPTLFINGKPLKDFSPEGLASQVASEIRLAYKS